MIGEIVNAFRGEKYLSLELRDLDYSKREPHQVFFNMSVKNTSFDRHSEGKIRGKLLRAIDRPKLAEKVVVKILSAECKYQKEVFSAPLIARWSGDGDFIEIVDGKPKLTRRGETQEKRLRSIKDYEVSNFGITNISKDSEFTLFVYQDIADMPKYDLSSCGPVTFELQAIGENAYSQVVRIQIEYNSTNNTWKASDIDAPKPKRKPIAPNTNKLSNADPLPG